MRNLGTAVAIAVLVIAAPAMADEASVIGDKVYITREDGHVVTCRVVGPTIAIPGSNKREMADFDTVFCPSQVCVVYDGRMGPARGASGGPAPSLIAPRQPDRRARRRTKMALRRKGRPRLSNPRRH
jgi:hypothetical protein